jgi:hypothetical protein
MDRRGKKKRVTARVPDWETIQAMLSVKEAAMRMVREGAVLRVRAQARFRVEDRAMISLVDCEFTGERHV